MSNCFKSERTYHAGEFKCITCDHTTTIFIDTKYDLFNLMESDQTCGRCEEEKDALCDGDMIGLILMIARGNCSVRTCWKKTDIVLIAGTKVR